MEWFAKTYLKDARAKILDIGSYDVNGNYRGIFIDERFEYTGLDMEDGPNVDIVPHSPYQWSEIKNDSYDVVISGQALEHIEFFWVTVEEMIRVTKEGGLLCIIAPNGFDEHRYPVDCWRFFTDGMIAIARYWNLEILHAHTNAAPSLEDEEWYSADCADTMLVAKKIYSGEAKKIDLTEYECKPARHSSVLGEMKTYSEYKRKISESAEKKNEITEIKSKRTLIEKIRSLISKMETKVRRI